MEKVHKRYYSWYCTCKGLLSGVRANNWGAFLGNGSVPRKKIHCTDGEKMNFDSNAFVCNVNYWEGHLFRHIDYRDPQSYNLCGTSLLLENLSKCERKHVLVMSTPMPCEMVWRTKVPLY